VVFNLSSWAAQRKPLNEWMVDELNERYSVPKKLAQAWVDQEQILLLLDGLDEVAAEHRAECAERINAYRQEHGMVPMAVCSRVEEFEALDVRLLLQGAVVIKPLTRGQVDAYLNKAGEPLTGVRASLAGDATLYELLDTPLMLSVVTMGYSGASASLLQAAGTIEERRKRLFAVYVDAMQKRRGAETCYAQDQTYRWLSWLAGQMQMHGQSVFLLERIQSDWLPRRWQQQVVFWGPSVIGSLVVGLLVGLFVGLGGGLASSLALGLGSGLAVGLVLRLGVELGGRPTGQLMKPAETLHWSWPAASRGLVAGLVVGLVGLSGGLVVELAVALFGEWVGGRDDGWVDILVGQIFALDDELVGGLVLGLFIGLAGALIGGLATGEMTRRTTPNEGIRRSAQSALISASVGGLFVGLFVGLVVGVSGLLAGGPLGGLVGGLFAGLCSGWVIGLLKGGYACLGHLVLRALLVRSDLVPWKTVAFLNYAADRIFLRKVGGGYIFIHRLLQDYFAELWEREYGGASKA
jgi:hypothetical protein